jgi:hypothetical protein
MKENPEKEEEKKIENDPAILKETYVMKGVEKGERKKVMKEVINLSKHCAISKERDKFPASEDGVRSREEEGRKASQHSHELICKGVLKRKNFEWILERGGKDVVSERGRNTEEKSGMRTSLFILNLFFFSFSIFSLFLSLSLSSFIFLLVRFISNEDNGRGIEDWEI